MGGGTASPRWRHRTFLSSLPSQEEPLTAVLGEDTTDKVLEPGGEAEAPPCTTETEKIGHEIRKQFARKFQQQQKLLKTFRETKLYEDFVIHI